MHKILAVGFVGIFCLAASGPVYSKDYIHCLGCEDVDPYNNCFKRSYTCIAWKMESCFNRIVSKDGVLLFVDRGCISNCIHVQRDSHYRNLTWCCDDKDHCNQYNIWPNYLPSESAELS